MIRTSRREFLSRFGMGFGALGLANLLSDEVLGQVKATHFPAKAKHVIHIFAAGAPSQVDRGFAVESSPRLLPNLIEKERAAELNPIVVKAFQGKSPRNTPTRCFSRTKLLLSIERVPSAVVKAKVE